MAGYAVDHHLSDDESNIHRSFDNSLDPVLTIEPGEVVGSSVATPSTASSTSNRRPRT